MAVKPCSVGEDHPSALIISLVANGDTEYLCVAHAPDYIKALWDAAGYPSYVMDFDDQELGESDLSGDQAPGVEDPGVPDGPGVLEQIEARDGPVPVKPTPARARKSAENGSHGGEPVGQSASSSTDVDG